MNRRQLVASAVALAAIVEESRRVSCDGEDPGYARWMRMGGFDRRWYVALDGQELKFCITADPSSGYAVVLDLSATGNPYVLPGTNHVAKRVVYGDVRVYRDGVLV